MPTRQTPLVAVNAKRGLFCARLEAAAGRIGTDFFSSTDLDVTLRECNRRNSSCVIIDCDNEEARRLDTFPVAENRSLFFAVEKGDVRTAFQAARAGATSVLEKPVTEDDLVVTLKTAFACEVEIEKLNGANQRFSNVLFSGLSVREKDVLSLLMSGEPNKRVASILDLGLRTVESDRAHVMKKLKVHSFVELITLVAESENDGVSLRQKIFKLMLEQRM